MKNDFNKTALQELKDWANKYEGQMISADQVVLKAHNLLEKEKQQIEIAFDLGRDEVTSVFIIDGENYYNKSYNQNK